MADDARSIVQEHAASGVTLREEYFRDHTDDVVDVARRIAVCMARGGKLLLAGNGGSAADAQHVSAEFVNRFLMERPPLPAIALTTDTSAITAIGNDYGFDQVFEKQVQALGASGDMLLAISTSGNSANLVRALKAARDKGLTTIGLTAGEGGEMARYCDHLLAVQHTHTPLIQEVHLAIEHLLCQLVDHYLFEAVVELTPYLDED